MTGLLGGASGPDPGRSDVLVQLDSLLARYPFSPYRRYPVLGLERGRGAPPTERLRLAMDPLIVLDGTDGPRGAVGYWRHALESDVLGIEVYRTTALYTGSADRHAECRDLAGALLEAVTAPSGPALVVLRVDADDLHALSGAQAGGFRVVEAAATWLSPPVPDLEVAEPPGHRLIRMSIEDRAGIPDADIEDIVAAARRRFRATHFHGDPNLDPARIDDLYQAWTRNSLRGGWGEVAHVMRADEGTGRVVGFVAHSRERRQIAETTIDCQTSSFGLVCEDAPAGTGMCGVRSAIRDLDGQLIEMTTQMRNKLTGPYARLFPAFNAFYTLHGWAP